MGRARSTTRRLVGSLLILCLLLSVLIVIRARSWGDLPEWDTGTYYVIGNELNHGKSLYADTWDMKPPGIFYTYAAAMRVVSSDWQTLFFVLSIVTAGATLSGIWLVASTLSRSAAIWSALFWCALCFEPSTAANLPNCESFMNAFIVLGWAAFVRASTPSPSTLGEGRGEGSVSNRQFRWTILAGTLFAIASVYKQVAFAPALLLAICHVALASSATRRRSLGGSMAMLMPVAVVWAMLFGWFALTGRARLLWETVFSYSRFYAGNPGVNLIHTFTRSAWASAPLLALWPVAALTSVAVGLLWRGPDQTHRRFAALLAAMLVGSWVAVATPGHWLGHYFQLLFPVLAVGAGAACAGMIRLRPELRVVAVLAVIATFWPQLDWLKDGGATWAARRDRGWLTATRQDFVKAEGLVPKDQPVYVWGDEPWLYVITNRRCPYAAVWRQHAIDGPLADQLTTRTLQQLQSNPPALIACFGGAWPEEHPIVQWMHQEGYEPVPGLNPYPLQCFVRTKPQ